MLSEEALLLFTALAGGVFLVLGALDLIWPTRSRHPQRPDAGTKDPWRRARTTPAPALPATRVTRLSRREARAATAREAASAPTTGSEPAAPPEGASPANATPDAPVVPSAPEPTPSPEPVAPPPPEHDAALTPYEAALAAQAETARHDPPPAIEGDAGPRPQGTVIEGAGPRPHGTPAPVTPPPAEPMPVEAERVGRGDKGTARERRTRERRPAPARAVVEGAGPRPHGTPAPVTPAPVAPAETSTIERCFALYMDRNYAEAVAMASKALAQQPDDLPRNEAAGLWGVLALAKEAAGDEVEARGAFEKAIAVAPPDDRRTWQRHLASLAMKSGQAHMARARNRDAVDGGERVAAVRAAAEWFEVGVAASPDDAALVPGLIQRQEFGEARRLLREALSDEDCPPPQQSAFRELLSATFSGEVGQLTAEAIANMQDAKEGEALAALERAVALLEQIHEGGLSPKRREELERRLWWGYTKLGLRLIEAAQFDEAIEPLFEALRLAGVGADRQAETRGALVKALEGLVETRVRVIREIASEGDRDTALQQSEKLWALLRSSMAQGLSQDDLSTPLGKTQKLFEQLRKNRA
ncbi:MAG: hypothetical protein HY216_10965 [Candidatus Rokubacteria bacterium]|nr:hypothetical protein [Candidatus Rokubacteria bacterium]